MHDRNIEDGLEPVLNVKTAGRADVFQVDAAEGRGHRGDDLDDGVDVLRAQAQRPAVDVREFLEEHHLAFHHRQRCFRAQVAEAENGRAIRNHGHAVGLARERIGFRPVLSDRPAHPRDAGCVGHR